jgi:O-antigen ligase
MATIRRAPQRRRSPILGLLALALVAIGALLVAIAAFPNLASWYAGLAKPSFNPGTRRAAGWRSAPSSPSLR